MDHYDLMTCFLCDLADEIDITIKSNSVSTGDDDYMKWGSVHLNFGEEFFIGLLDLCLKRALLASVLSSLASAFGGCC